MSRRAVYFLTALLTAVSALLAYEVVANVATSTPLGASLELTVTDWSGEGTATELRQDAVELAESEQITFGQVIPSMSNGRTQRGLYLASGNQQTLTRVASGVDFGHNMETIIHELTDLDLESPIGTWVAFDIDNPESLYAFLEQHDLEYTTESIPTLPRVTGNTTNITTLFSVCVLIAVGAGGSYAVAGGRRFGILRLNGRSVRFAIVRDILPVATTWFLTALSIAILELVLAAVDFGQAGIVPFISQTMLFASVLLAAEIAAYLLVVAMLWQTEILKALKGDLPGGKLIVSTYILRIAAVAVALSLGSSTVSLAVDASERATAQADLDSLGDASVLSLGNAYNETDQDALGATVNDWLRELDEQGNVYLAVQDTVTIDGSVTSLLIVNQAFLEQQDLYSDLTKEINSSDRQDIHVIVPETLWGSRDDVLLQLESELSLLIREMSDRSLIAHESSGDQTVFTMTAPAEVSNSINLQSAYVTNPILVVVPAGAYDDYVSPATSDQVIIHDRTSAVSAIQDDPELARFVRSVTPVSSKADAVTAEKATEYRDSILATACSYVVVLISGYAIVAIFSNQNGQRIFARHVNGWSMRQMYRRLWTIEAILVVGIVVWLPWQIKREREEILSMFAGNYDSSLLPTVDLQDLIPILALVLIVLGGIMLSVVVTHSRVIRDGVRRA